MVGGLVGGFVGGIALVYLFAARLAYVLWVGKTLQQQDREQRYTREFGVDEGYARFKRISHSLMLNDSIAFIFLNIVTIDTFHLPVPRIAVTAVGLVIGIFGIAVKTWATMTLGSQAYYWHNFFVPTIPEFPNPPGPYKYLKNPMYGVGYWQTYGLALVCGSFPGLIASVFMQGSIMIFNRTVETPHYLALLKSEPNRNVPPRSGGLEPGAAPRFS